jgi:hypothetical protein
LASTPYSQLSIVVFLTEPLKVTLSRSSSPAPRSIVRFSARVPNSKVSAPAPPSAVTVR